MSLSSQSSAAFVYNSFTTGNPSQPAYTEYTALPKLLLCLLQIREGPSRPGSAALGEGGLETKLAQAEACLVSGQLSAAASQLQKVVQVIDWCPTCCDCACINSLAAAACYCTLAVGTMHKIDFCLTTQASKTQNSHAASIGRLISRQNVSTHSLYVLTLVRIRILLWMWKP